MTAQGAEYGMEAVRKWFCRSPVRIMKNPEKYGSSRTYIDSDQYPQNHHWLSGIGLLLLP